MANFNKHAQRVGHFVRGSRKVISHISNFIEKTKPYYTIYGHHIPEFLDKYNVPENIKKVVNKGLEITPHIYGIHDVLNK